MKADEIKLKELRIQLPVNLPFDPLYLKSMADYDLSLMLYSPWLEYDEGRKAKKGLLADWQFDPNSGQYLLKIESRLWSDGSPILASHLVENLKRIIKSKTSYGKSIAKIIKIETAKAISETQISFNTKNNLPSESLFNQLGSVFLSLVHPNDLNKSTGTRLSSNSIFSGPYIIESETPSEIIFTKNRYYSSTNTQMPERVVARKHDDKFSFETFLESKTWENYFQTNTFLPIEEANRIKSATLPMWTRGIDRVMLMRPLGKGVSLESNQKLLCEWGVKWSKHQFTHPLQVKIARSLQPLGYPLFKDISFKKPHLLKKRKIKIIAMSNPSLKLAQSVISELVADSKIEVSWQILTPAEFLGKSWESFGADYALFSFGVADPEPTTWLGLVFGSNFIQYTKSERHEFETIASDPNTESQVKKYRKLLHDIGSRGGYLPLLHGATLSLGHKNLSFDLVNSLDETVDYSKIKISN